jgi:hypothetical protein|uniref:ERCC4 domain-containing protein EP364R n=1 Tax=Siphoviridae sp. ctuy39 TaxID=2825719 RepID=A0A8S5VEI6_9CAUD|nr:MAG TPA: ERCC4 domain protein [Siphoviridae sp. ctuy39]
MNNFEVASCLESMQIIVDSNEQPSKRAFKRYDSFGVPYDVQKIDYGDYTYNFKLPNGKWIYEPNTRLYPPVSIERKADLVELSQCFCQSRERFTREFERAKANKAKMYLLVENASWENLINGKYATKYNPKAYFASITAWQARYGIQTIFCKQETSGKLIKEILYRELKERLERGYYDSEVEKNEISIDVSCSS